MNEPRCANCATELLGDYCHSCGQSRTSNLRFLGALMADWFENLFDRDSRVHRTLIPLMLFPGQVAVDYLSGKRVRFFAPFRLYLVCSIGLFFISAIMPSTQVDEDSNEIIRDEFSITHDIEDETGLKIETLGDLLETAEKQANAEAEPGSGIAVDVSDPPDVMIALMGEQRAKERLSRLKSIEPEELFDELRDNLPTALFVLLPVFALILKLLYIRRPMLYVEHLVVALYSHSFIFLSLMLSELGGGLALATSGSKYLGWVGSFAEMLETLLVVWIPVYLLIMQKRVYRNGWAGTSVRYLFCGLAYLVLLLGVVVLALIWSVFSI